MKRIKNPRYEIIGWVIAIVFLMIFPLFSNKLTFMVNIVIYSLFAMGYNICFGHSGMMTMAQGAFVGIGGFIVAILFSFWKTNAVAFLISLVVVTAVAYILAIMLFMRLKVGSNPQTRSLYSTIVTLGFLQIMYYLSISVFSRWTGGSHGISAYLRTPVNFGLFQIDMLNKTNSYYFIVIVGIISIITMRWFMSTPCREMLSGIRENELRLAFLGHDVRSRKILMFIISCFFCGIAGCLNACAYGVLDANTFSFNYITEAMIICVVGGRRTFYGPILGTIIYLAAKYFISMYTDAWLLIVAAIIVIVCMYAPDGIGGIVQKMKLKKVNREA